MTTPALVLEGARVRSARLAAYVALTKPRIIELLLVTTLPTMFVAERGLPPVWLMVATLAGGALAAGGANALNMVIDRDIDRVMHRTRNRPLVTGVLTPRQALVFALALEVVAFAEGTPVTGAGTMVGRCSPRVSARGPSCSSVGRRRSSSCSTS